MTIDSGTNGAASGDGLAGGASAEQPPATERPPTIPPAFREYAVDDLPNATPGGHGKDGLLEATLGRSGGVPASEDPGDERNEPAGGPTRLLRDRAEVPLHLTGALDHDPIGPTLVVQEPTGGVAQGDRHEIAITAREGARGVVTTQSATKVHSMHSDYAHLDVAVEIGHGAHVEYVPRPTIVNEDARCLQTARVDLAAGASAIVADVLVPDGLSAHAPFGFDHYHARIDARHEGALVCGDAVDLGPGDRDPRNPATVGEANCIGTLYVLAPDAGADGEGDETGRVGSIDGLADRIHDRLGEADPGDETLRAGASVLPFDAGVGVRAVGAHTAAVETAIEAARDEARRALLGVGVPDDRRY